MKVILYYIEFCANSIGVWDRHWFLNHDDALVCFDFMVKEEGFNPELTDGTERSILPVRETEVSLTREGLLAFANTFAIDTGAC